MTLTVSVLQRGAMGQHHKHRTPGVRKGRVLRNLVSSTKVQRVRVVLYSTVMTNGNFCDF